MTRRAQVAAAKLARKTITVIEERGWCKHTNIDKQGRVCLLGAINIARGVEPHDDNEWTPAGNTLYNAIQTEVNNYVTLWNDDKERRKGHVLRVLKTVADKLQAGEYE